MNKMNIFKDKRGQLEVHSDDRGIIADVFYSTSINHVAFITSKPNVIRGNHYHQKSTQSILITKGSLEYWYKDLDADVEPRFVMAEVGDLITSEPTEIHALRIGEFGCEFVAFTVGKRGGSDYESDTFRVDSIIVKR